ncbi:MAG: hypothetical protein KJ995_08175, partial [Candidatus Omnitrophica bacterium]|nr:hypothetical protein [Candidatus Omnitrophota bacterium]MBU1852363.1 hypothetical protein [Candidatus Omnitrophota bacterium]
YIYTDMLLVMFTVLAYNAIYSFYKIPTLKNYLAAGIMIGLAAGAKYNDLTEQYEFDLNAYASDRAEWSWQNEGYMQMSEDLTEYMANVGFQQAIDNYAGDFLDDEMMNAIDTFGISAGEYFQGKIDANDMQMTTLADGVVLAEVGVLDDQGNDFGDAYFAYNDSTGKYDDLYGYNYGDFEAFGDIFINPYSDLKFLNGHIIETVEGYTIQQMINNGMQEYVQFSDLYGKVVLDIAPITEGENIYVLDDGSLIDGFVTYSDGNFAFSNGALIYMNVDGVQFDLLNGEVDVTGLEGQNIDIETQGWDIMDKIMSSYEEFGSLLGTSIAYADTNYETSDTIPEGQYAIRFYAARPTGLDYGSEGKIGETGDRTGHTFIALVDAHGNEIRSGLYPDPTDLINPTDPINSLIANHISDIRDDGAHHYHESTQWYIISAFDYVEIQAYLDEGVYEATHPWYNLASNNCTDLALNVAEMLGIVLPYDDGAYSNPQSFANALLEADIARYLGHSDFTILSENYLPDNTREVYIKNADGIEETIILQQR